jgi:hypothetical protein
MHRLRINHDPLDENNDSILGVESQSVPSCGGVSVLNFIVVCSVAIKTVEISLRFQEWLAVDRQT